MLPTKMTALLAGGAIALSTGVIAPAAQASAHPGTSGAHTTSVQVAPKFSDDELLTAILFGIGPAAYELGIHLAEETPLPDDYGQVATELLREYQTNHPGATEEAATAFRSGNPVRVHSAVKSLQQSFQKAYLEESASKESGAYCAAVNLVLAGNIAVFLNVGLAVTLAVVTYVVTYQVQSESDAELISARLSDLGEA